MAARLTLRPEMYFYSLLTVHGLVLAIADACADTPRSTKHIPAGSRCSGVPGRDRWQASQNFAALAGVVRDAMNLPRKKIRTSLGVLSEVDNNINALTTLPWGKSASGEEQHQHARWVAIAC